MRGFPNGINDNDHTKYLFNGPYCRAGDVLPGGWPFSTRYLECPWLARACYGPEASTVLAGWEEVRDTPVEPGWGVYFGDDTSQAVAAYSSCGGPVPLTPGQYTQHCYNLCLWLVGKADARGTWPTRQETAEDVGRWDDLYETVLPVARQLRELLPPLFRRHNAFQHRKEEAARRDMAYAERFPKDDGPPVRVVGCEMVRTDDPQVFSGPCWVAVVPAEVHPQKKDDRWPS
jgi:hypothetical protein